MHDHRFLTRLISAVLQQASRCRSSRSTSSNHPSQNGPPHSPASHYKTCPRHPLSSRPRPPIRNPQNRKTRVLHDGTRPNSTFMHLSSSSSSHRWYGVHMTYQEVSYSMDNADGSGQAQLRKIRLVIIRWMDFWTQSRMCPPMSRLTWYRITVTLNTRVFGTISPCWHYFAWFMFLFDGSWTNFSQQTAQIHHRSFLIVFTSTCSLHCVFLLACMASALLKSLSSSV